MINTVLDRLRSKLKRFAKCERGNILMTFTLAIIPVIGFVGTAVDYSRANSAKAAMQSALDSTGLMLSKDAQTVTGAQLATKANGYFLALFNRPDVTNVVLTPTLTYADQWQLQAAHRSDRERCPALFQKSWARTTSTSTQRPRSSGA